MLLAEGPETGLAGWAATGCATLIALGSLSKLDPPPFAVLLADDDPRHSPAEKALERTLRTWRARGRDVTVCRPWAARRYDKSDMADVILAEGSGAVRARITRALDPGTSAARRVPLPIARVRLARVMDAFNARAVASPEPIVQAVRVDTGAGKSREARQQAVTLVRSLRAQGDTRAVCIALPRHDLADEYVAELRVIAPDLVVSVWRGRDAKDPDTPGSTMCSDIDVVKEVQAASLDPDTYACGPCAFVAECAYQRQRRLRADIRVFSSALLAHAPPKAFGTLAALFVDENPLAAFLIGDDTPLRLALDTLERPARIEGDPLATDRLMFLRRAVSDVLRHTSDGPLQRAAFLALNLTAASIKEARGLEWRTRTEPRFTPGMSREQRREAVRSMIANRDLGRRSLFWTALETLLAFDGPTASGWVALKSVDGDAGPSWVLQLRGRRLLAKGWQVPTMLLDATLEPGLLRHIWPGLVMVADLAIQAQHMHVHQVTDRACSKAMLDPSGTRDPQEAQRRMNR